MTVTAEHNANSVLRLKIIKDKIEATARSRV
jgi:hypothetical protein